MARKSKQTTKIKNVVDQRSRGGVRQRIRGNLGNSMVLRGNEMLEGLVVPANSTKHSLGYPLVGGNTTARDSVVFANVAKSFQQYLYMPGTVLHYQPAVGLNTPGNIYVAYIDNPECIADWYSAGVDLRITMVKSNSTIKAFPVWQEFTLPISGVPRLKRFPTDTSVDFTSEIDNTKSVQGLFAVCIEGVTSTTPAFTIGRCYLQQALQLETLAYATV